MPKHNAADLRTQGVANALGALAAHFNQRELALQVMEVLGYSVRDLVEAGAAQFDMIALLGQAARVLIRFENNRASGLN